MEKVGLAGAAPGLLGLVSADAAVGLVGGAATLLTFGTLAPYIAAALGGQRGRALVGALLAASLATAALASVAYRQPYSRDHPKRLLVQHIHSQGPGESPLSLPARVRRRDKPVSPQGWILALLIFLLCQPGPGWNQHLSSFLRRPPSWAWRGMAAPLLSCRCTALTSSPPPLLTPPPVHVADGAVTGSRLSVVGLDSFVLEPVLPPSFLEQPPAPAYNSDWEVRCVGGCGCTALGMPVGVGGRLQQGLLQARPVSFAMQQAAASSFVLPRLLPHCTVFLPPQLPRARGGGPHRTRPAPRPARSHAAPAEHWSRWRC